MERFSHGRTRLALGVILGLLPMLAGCAPWSTFPGTEGSFANSNPRLTPIPEVMADAIWYVHARDGRGGEIVFNLPPGTPSSVYDRVIDRLDGDARPMREPGEVAYHVTEVRVRTVESEVDVVHTNTADDPQMVTIRFRQNLLTGLRVERVRDWRYPVTVPEPNYVPPPGEAVAEGPPSPAPTDGP